MPKISARIKVHQGQEVSFLTKQGDRLQGLVVKIQGDVYTVQLRDSTTRPVHHKYLERVISPWPQKAKETSRADEDETSAVS